MINFEPMRELELITKLETFYDINVILIIRDLQIFLPNNLSNFKQNFILQLHDTKEQKKKSFTSFPKNFPADILKGDPLHIENFLFTPSRVFPFSPFL